MTAGELDGFLRDQLAQLDAQRPGAARPGYLRNPERFQEAKAVLRASVAGKTGVAAEFVADLLDRRELVRQPTHHNPEALAEAADTGFVASVMAAAAWTAASAPVGAKARAQGVRVT